MLLVESLPAALAQIDNRRHVGFVERRQNGGRLLNFYQALCNPLPNAGHALARLAANAGGGSRWSRGVDRRGQLALGEFSFLR